MTLEAGFAGKVQRIEAGEAGEDGDEDEGLLDSSYSVCTS